MYAHTMPRLNDVLDQLWDRRLPEMIQAYFEDMEYVLIRLLKMAQPGAGLWLVVSTSAYAGIEIPVDLILAEVGTNAGWQLREVGVLRHLRSSGQHMRTRFGKELGIARLRESVVMFEAPRNGHNARRK